MSNAAVMEERQAVPVVSGEHAKVQTPKSQVDWRGIWKPLVIIIGGFLVFFWLPVTNSRFTGAVIESLALAKWYAQEHVILCLVPAFFIAGAIACFVSQAAVIKYLGAGARKVRGSLGIRHYISGLFLYGAPSFCKHLETWCRIGTGNRFSILRSCGKCAGNCAYHPRARGNHRNRQGCGGDNFQHHYRPSHASFIQERGTGKGRFTCLYA